VHDELIIICMALHRHLGRDSGHSRRPSVGRGVRGRCAQEAVAATAHEIHRLLAVKRRQHRRARAGVLVRPPPPRAHVDVGARARADHARRLKMHARVSVARGGALRIPAARLRDAWFCEMQFVSDGTGCAAGPASSRQPGSAAQSEAPLGRSRTNPHRRLLHPRHDHRQRLRLTLLPKREVSNWAATFRR
jgi:hypothetical protein